MARDEITSSHAALLQAAAQMAVDYLDQLDQRAVAPSPAAIAGMEGLSGSLPEAGHEALETLEHLHGLGSPATVASAGRRYFGFVTGGALPATLAASWLARAWDQNAGLAVMSPVASRLDEVALRWMVELLQLPAGAGGAFATGATMANAAALMAARNELLGRAGWDVDADGLFGAPQPRVFVGAEAHSSLFKALSMVGFGRSRVEVLPADEQGAIIADALPALDERPTLLCLQAGNVNSGASDPFEPLIDWTRGASAWVHVDGAFGLWAAASEKLGPQVRGVERADSWATDAHKWLNVPYDCGAVFVRDPAHLAAAFTQRASYLPAAVGRDPLTFSPESSQRARGVEVWAALHHLGRQGVEELVDRCCVLAAQAAAGLRARGLEVVNDVRLNQVVFCAGDDATTAALLAAVQADGTAWMGPTTWRGRAGIRLSVSSWATTSDDIELTLAAIDRCLSDLAGP